MKLLTRLKDDYSFYMLHYEIAYRMGAKPHSKSRKILNYLWDSITYNGKYFVGSLVCKCFGHKWVQLTSDGDGENGMRCPDMYCSRCEIEQ